MKQKCQPCAVNKMSDWCTHCEKSSYFIVNDDNFEVCATCGFVQNVHFENVAKAHPAPNEDNTESGSGNNSNSSNNKRGDENDEGVVFPMCYFRPELKEENKLKQQIRDLCLVFHKKSTRQKCLSLYYRLKQCKPKDKKISDDKILKYAFYISSNEEKCPLALPDFLAQSEMTLKQFKRISRIFHKNFISEEPEQHLSALCWVLNIDKKEQGLIRKVLNDTHSEHFEEHTLFTFLAVLLQAFSLFTRNERNQLDINEICELCGSRSKSNVTKILKAKREILHSAFLSHLDLQKTASSLPEVDS